MAYPLSPGVKNFKGEQPLTDYGVAAKPNPFGKQGNVSSGSKFSATGPNDSPGGDAGDYRVPGTSSYTRFGAKHSGFGAIKSPTTGMSPKGRFPASKKGNFGRV